MLRSRLTPRSQIRGSVALVTVGLVACSGAEKTDKTVDVEHTSTTGTAETHAAPRTEETFSFVVLERPAGGAIDGNIAEWGDITPDPAQLTEAPVENRFYPEGAEPLPSAPNPSDARSHIAVALDDRLTVAGSLAESTSGGIWIGVGALAPELPAIGTYGRAINIAPFDCEFKQECCNDGDMIKTEPLPPEAAEACRKTVARYDEFGKQYAAQFERVYRIDASGVQFQDEKGKLTPIKDAKVAFAAVKDGVATFEASIPLSALPRMSQAPISTLRFMGASASRPAPAPLAQAPHAKENPWIWLNLPLPVSYEPHAAFRGILFAEAQGYYPGHSPALSYLASDPARVQSLERNGDMTAVEPVDGPLLEPYDKLGSVEISLARIPYTQLVLTQGAELIGSVSLPDASWADPKKMCFAGVREGNMHYLGYVPGGYNPMMGYYAPSWWLTVIQPDGIATMDALSEDHSVDFNHEHSVQFANNDCSEFGIRGPEGQWGDTQLDVQYELKWKWDKKAKKYVVSKKEIKGPKQPAKKKS